MAYILDVWSEIRQFLADMQASRFFFWILGFGLAPSFGLTRIFGLAALGLAPSELPEAGIILNKKGGRSLVYVSFFSNFGS